jgi:hypothetical protein
MKLSVQQKGSLAKLLECAERMVEPHEGTDNGQMPSRSLESARSASAVWRPSVATVQSGAPRRGS